MLGISIKTIKSTNIWLKKGMSESYSMGLLRGVKKAMLYAEGEAKLSFNKSGNLKVRSGHLRRSIKSDVEYKRKTIIGRLWTNVIYAAIHEYGGVIVPVRARFLSFKINNTWITTKRVVMPKRPYLYPAIKNNLNTIEDIIIEEIDKEIN